MNDKINEDVKETPTDIIARAMESADIIEDIIIVYRFKKEDGSSGLGWFSNIEATTIKVGLLEEAKMCVFGKAYIPQEKE